ncbi:hypothetical protein [Aneurinibacillus sp. REN35]|uniref:hypothetical protein n=1 Tax=Aneurinibacillus sp. REN35 TaxID=3237286 RepID=UPI0035275EDB
MDFWGGIIILSIVASGLLMIVGPIMEMRGKILFLQPSKPPKTKARWGMGLMIVSFILFIAGLFLRAALPSEVVTPIVLGSFVLWFVGGFAAVIRNEVLKVMLAITEVERPRSELNESRNF